MIDTDALSKKRMHVFNLDISEGLWEKNWIPSIATF